MSKWPRPQPYAPARALRSAAQLQLAVPGNQEQTSGGHCLSCCGPPLWNQLLSEIRQAQSLFLNHF